MYSANFDVGVQVFGGTFHKLSSFYHSGMKVHLIGVQNHNLNAGTNSQKLNFYYYSSWKCPDRAGILNILVLNPYGLAFHAVVVFILEFDFLFVLCSADCVLHALAWS